MTNEELNTALYKKMYAEQEEYEKWLLAQPPEEILKHAYEFTVRQDILLSLEYHDLTDAQASALLKSPGPLGDIFKEFESRETDYMDTVFESMVSRADSLIKEEMVQEWEVRWLLVYHQNMEYAEEHGAVEQYRASHAANVACKEAIEAAIAKHFQGYSLGKEATQEVVKEFGVDRILYVLANTVRQQERDGRISSDNKEWARTMDVCEDPDKYGRNRNTEFVVDTNAGLTDLFLSQVRQEQLMQTPLSEEEIWKEAEWLLSRLKRQRHPIGPDHAHFMTSISTEFMKRSSNRDLDRLLDLMPFQTAGICKVDGVPGYFMAISKDEDRNRTLVGRKPSIREKLQRPSEKPRRKNSEHHTPGR